MKNKIKPGLLLVFIIVCIFVLGISSCGHKYFLELKASYNYDKDSGVLIKFPSEITFEANEIITYENKKTTTIEYEIANAVLPKRNSTTGELTDTIISIAYTVYNDKLIFPAIPMQYSAHNYFILGNSTDSVIVTIDNENAYLVNLKESTLKKLYNDADFDSYFEEAGKDTKFIYAKTISISPDGKYLLYVSKRNYLKDGSPNSLDIYFYDIQTGEETKIMNFEGKEFLCWEKLDINPGASGNFLFRETSVSKTEGRRIYSPIKRYSITQSAEDIFSTIKLNGEILNTYEMIDGQYAYIFKSEQKEIDGVKSKENTIYIADIYSGEIKFTVDTEKYSSVWHIVISGNKEYIAFFGSYLNVNGIAIPEILTLHLETNDLVAQYEQIEGDYFIDSFEWCPDNTLLVNFQNTINLYKDLCRLHTITHKNEKLK
jgi:hypothetical protein